MKKQSSGLCFLLSTYLFLCLPFSANSQKEIFLGRQYFNSAGMFCGQSFIFYKAIGFYSTRCELHHCDINAFTYRQQNDSIYLQSLKLSEYPIIKKIEKRKTKQKSIQVIIYDIQKKPIISSLLLFERRKGSDSLLGEYVVFTEKEIKKYSNSKKYYWTIKNVFPIFSNEFTLSFPLAAYDNDYRIYFNLPAECLLATESKAWTMLEGTIKIHSKTSICFNLGNELCFDTYDNP